MGMTGDKKEEKLITPEQKTEWASGISDIFGGNSGKIGELNSQGKDAKQTLTDIQEQYDHILNEDFSYNPAYDPLFKQYAAEYMERGQLAMKNAMAESSMLTGGYGNSWMATAGAQAWDSVMDEFNALIPELRAAAYDEWSADKVSTLADLEGDLAAQREIADAIDGEIDGIVADNEEELINYIAQGVIDGIITEDDIDDYLPAYDDTFTDEEIAALTDEVLATVDAYELMKAEKLAKQNGVVADIMESIIKNPDLNNEEYLTAELGRHGYSYDDSMKEIFGSVNVEPINDLKPPKDEHIEKAKEKYAQSETAYLNYENELVAMGYDVSKLKDIVFKGAPQESEGIKAIKNRRYTRVGNDTKNHLGGLDRNDKYSYVNSEGETVTQKGIDIRKELQDAGMSKYAATEWIEKYLQKDGK